MKSILSQFYKQTTCWQAEILKYLYEATQVYTNIKFYIVKEKKDFAVAKQCNVKLFCNKKEVFLMQIIKIVNLSGMPHRFREGMLTVCHVYEKCTQLTIKKHFLCYYYVSCICFFPESKMYINGASNIS